MNDTSSRPCGSRKLGALFVAMIALNCFIPEALADCASGIPGTPVTITGEQQRIPQSRELVNGINTTINKSNVGQAQIDVTSPSSIKIENYSAGSIFSPSANTYTLVTNDTQINLPATSAVPVGATIVLAFGVSLAPISIVSNAGVGNENIIFNGSKTNGSIPVKAGDQIALANQGSGVWLVTSFLPQGGAQGSSWSLSQGGTGGYDQPSGFARNPG